MNTIVKLKKLTPNAIIPTYGTAQSAGADLYSGMEQPVTIEPGKTEFIHTGIAIAIPEGYAGFVQPRSGLAIKQGVTVLNTPGLIDSHYRGELKVALINLDPNNVFQVKPGDRIAQLVIQKVEQVVWNVVSSLNETERGKGGFGSSGVA